MLPQYNWLCNDTMKCVFVTLLVEGQMPVDHEVENDTEAPKVHLLVVSFLLEDLWGSVLEGPKTLFVLLSREGYLRETEVD